MRSSRTGQDCIERDDWLPTFRVGIHNLNPWPGSLGELQHIEGWLLGWESDPLVSSLCHWRATVAPSEQATLYVSSGSLFYTPPLP